MKHYYSNLATPGVQARNPFVVDGARVLIQMPQGRAAVIDMVDLPAVANIKWTLVNSMARSTGQFSVGLHRWVMSVTDHRYRVEFVNGDPLDCRRANLRVAGMCGRWGLERPMDDQ